MIARYGTSFAQLNSVKVRGSPTPSTHTHTTTTRTTHTTHTTHTATTRTLCSQRSPESAFAVLSTWAGEYCSRLRTNVATGLRTRTPLGASEDRAEEGRAGVRVIEGRRSTDREGGRKQRSGREGRGRVPSRRPAALAGQTTRITRAALSPSRVPSPTTTATPEATAGACATTGPSRPTIAADSLSSISENEAVMHDYDAELEAKLHARAGTPLVLKLPTRSPALDGDAGEEGQAWQDEEADVGRSRTAFMRTQPERHQRKPQDLLRFEHRFTELANSGQGAAVSAAWAMLAERARDERIQDAAGRGAALDAARNRTAAGERGEGSGEGSGSEVPVRGYLVPTK